MRTAKLRKKSKFSPAIGRFIKKHPIISAWMAALAFAAIAGIILLTAPASTLGISIALAGLLAAKVVAGVGSAFGFTGYPALFVGAAILAPSITLASKITYYTSKITYYTGYVLKVGATVLISKILKIRKDKKKDKEIEAMRNRSCVNNHEFIESDQSAGNADVHNFPVTVSLRTPSRLPFSRTARKLTIDEKRPALLKTN